MPFRKSQAAFTSLVSRLVSLRQRKRFQNKRIARKRFLEQLEPRNLMALDIVSVTPVDGANDWALNTNLTITFNGPVVKGQGNIHVVQNSTGTLGVAVDVNSANVTIAGNTVTVDLPTDLLAAQAYTVYLDNGTFLDGTAVSTTAATLLTQNFDLLPLGPFTAPITVGDGTDFTLTPPLNYSVDNAALATGGLAPYRGWSFMDKNSWIREAGQSRDAFTKGSGTVALGDPDQFDDAANGGAFNSKFVSRPIKLTGVTANSVVLEFDSSFRPEDSQIGTLDVRFDGGAWTNILTLDPTNTNNNAPSATNNPVNLNEHLTSGINTGVSTGGLGNAPFRSIQNPVGATSMELRWGVVGQNDWWWAIDNLQVKGTVTGVPFLGVSSPTFWNLDIPFLTLGIDKTSMSENGGTATGTVTRNGSTAAALTVTLANNDTTEASIPASVMIPIGALSATFPITAVDDAIPDRTQTVTITASAPNFANVTRSIDVLDDEGPKIVSLSPIDNALGVDYRRDLSMTLTKPVKKGNGLINIVRTNGNLLVASLDVKSAAVTVSGATVTINPPADLAGNTDYYVLMDDGVFVDLDAVAATKTILQTTSFDLLPLGPFTAPATGGDGTDFTVTAPTGYNNNPAGTVLGGGAGSRIDFNKFNFFDKNAWAATTGGGARADFALASGVVAVADAATGAGTNVMQSFITTRPIDLANSATNPGVAAGSVSIEFDGSFSVGLPRIGTVEVSYDNGTNWQLIGNITGSSSNSHYVLNSAGGTGGGLDTFGLSPLNNPATGLMVFRFGLREATGGWAAIDNVKVFGSVSALTFEGITSPTTWNFTAVVPTLTLTLDKTSMPENGGTAIGTISRNAASTVDILVNLVSSDTTEATVPVSVLIPADTGVFSGPVSVTFTVTAVDDALKDGPQPVVITASSAIVPSYVGSTASIKVLDDEFPTVTTFSPVDNATAVPVGANLVVTFTEDVKKGNGFVHIIRASDGKSAQSINIQSAAVTIAGPVVTINPSADLAGLTNYYVAFDNGAILNNLPTVIIDTPLLLQDFELLTLGPAVTETVGLNANGRDFTATPPLGFTVNNSQMPPGGVPEWNGWTFADKSFWQTQGGQGRPNFTRGQGTIAIGDTDEWDDLPTLNNSFNSFFTTTPISLANVVGGALPAQGTVVLEFDSSFRPENSAAAGNQVGVLEVTYDGGTNWSNLFTYDITNTGGAATAPNVNERKVVNVPNPAASPTGSMLFRFSLTGTNDFWWAVDNLRVTASTTGLAYPGIANTDATTWNFATAEASTLTLTAPVPAISEKGGVATVTVSRNLATTGDLVVTLASSDVTLATVPATVTILDGQASATFDVTAVDDLLADGLKNVTITASTAGFVNGTANVAIADNEVANVIITEYMYNPGNGSANTGVKQEWIEVVNRGTVTADLGNWTIDDEDTTNWGKIAPGTLLAPGQVGVLYNSVFGSVTDTIFRDQWKVPATAVVVGMFWGDLANTPSAVGTLNENILLRDAGNVSIDQANYDDDGTIWPANTAGASIYLKNIYFNNDDGPNWGSTAVPPVDGTTRGPDGGISPVGPRYSVTDRGSPGFIQAFVPISTAVFYNDSGYETSGTVSDALDTHKVLLRSGGTTQTTSFANVSGYTRGLNGAVIDLMGLTNTLIAADFTFRVAPAGASGVVDPSTWAAAPAPTVINTTAGSATTAGRVRLEWTDNAIQNTWLQIIVKANANTGLTSPAVYYLGSALGDTNGAAGAGAAYRTGVPDLSAVQAAVSANVVLVNNVLDVDKSRRVGVPDLSYVQARVSSAVLLNNITIPVAGSAAEGSAAGGGGGGSARLSNSAAPPILNPTFVDVLLSSDRSLRRNDPTQPAKTGRIWAQSGHSAVAKPEQKPIALAKLENGDKIIENTAIDREFIDKFFAKLERPVKN